MVSSWVCVGVTCFALQTAVVPEVGLSAPRLSQVVELPALLPRVVDTVGRLVPSSDRFRSQVSNDDSSSSSSYSSTRGYRGLAKLVIFGVIVVGGFLFRMIGWSSDE